MKKFKYLFSLLLISMLCSSCGQNNAVVTSTSESVDIHSVANSVISNKISEAEEYYEAKADARAAVSDSNLDTTTGVAPLECNENFSIAFKTYLEQPDMTISCIISEVLIKNNVSKILSSEQCYLGSSSLYGSYYADSLSSGEQFIRYRKNYGYYDIRSVDKTWAYYSNSNIPVWYDLKPAQIVLQLYRNIYNDTDVILVETYTDTYMSYPCKVQKYTAIGDTELLVYIDEATSMPMAITSSTTIGEDRTIVSYVFGYGAKFAKDYMSLPADYSERSAD